MCAGIEAASVAWQPLGWHPAWFSEIDPHACSVLEARHPDTPTLGDMTEIHGADHGPIDLLVGGTPCQSFSVAGLRKGLDDDRGNLAFEFLRLVKEARPRWVVWENVPGVLSIDGGRAFGAFLGGLAELGFGWSYRILDAQFIRIQSHPRAQSEASASQSMNPAEVAPALDVGKAGGVAVAEGAPMTVRRLTPRECERLMGFPDDYTAVQHRGKPMADGPRYRLLGNSMAVNVMRWLGERIAIADELAP